MEVLSCDAELPALPGQADNTASMQGEYPESELPKNEFGGHHIGIYIDPGSSIAGPNGVPSALVTLLKGHEIRASSMSKL